MPVLDAYTRRAQLEGGADSSLSFTVRPIGIESFRQADVRDKGGIDSVFLVRLPEANGMRVLPLQLTQQYTSNRPYGWNDGAMIPAKGYQVFLSGGIAMKYGALRVNLRPEVVFAANPSFSVFPAGYSPGYEAYIDLPQRFGTGTYQKIFPGQSSVELAAGRIGFGLSTENLWWGPGRRNSMLMSNTAPGFPHVALRTLSPVRTGIGFFEGALLSGRLESSRYTDKPDDWRYLSAVVITWQPRWVQGLSLGITRAFQVYHENLSGFASYIPVLQDFRKDKTHESTIPRDQLASVFARWLWKAVNAEVYTEFARGDHSVNTRDFLLEPEHSRSYLVGMQKLLPVNLQNWKSLQVGLELTHLEQSNNWKVRNASSVYTHDPVTSGYTNFGQVIGAGIGPGSNSQSLDLTLVNGLKTAGLLFERVTYHDDYYGPRDAYTDFAIGLNASFTWTNKLLVSGALTTISSSWDPSDAMQDKDYVIQRSGNAQLKLSLLYAL